jgi:hypothetical protein
VILLLPWFGVSQIPDAQWWCQKSVPTLQAIDWTFVSLRRCLLLAEAGVAAETFEDRF